MCEIVDIRFSDVKINFLNVVIFKKNKVYGLLKNSVKIMKVKKSRKFVFVKGILPIKKYVCIDYENSTTCTVKANQHVGLDM